MTTSEVWILIAAIAAVLLVALVAGYALNKRRRVSLTAPVTETKEVTDRSGGYQASSGFSFSQGGKPAPEPVRVERTDDEGQPHVGDDAAIPRDAPKRAIHDVRLPDPVQGPELAPEVDNEVVTPENEPAAAEATEATVEPDESGTAAETSVVEESAAEVRASDAAEEEAAEAAVAAAEIAAAAEAAVAARTAAPETATPETATPAGVSEAAIAEIEPTSGRLERLRGRLSRSQNAVGKSLLGLLGGGDLDEDSWEEIEDTLVMADLGTAVTATIVERLRQEMATRSVRTAADARAVLREVLVEALRPELDRSIRALPHADHPSILLVVGVNGTGKTTTTGKLARVLVADGRRVLLGAADTFRAAAADQLQTWGERVGADTVRGKEGADPAAVAFDAVSAGIERGVDVVLIDTAGRLHTKTGLMDELGKVKRVVEKQAKVDEVILVLDSTVGQNGLVQARVFAEVVAITGVALTKLDGTAKGGIVFQVQHELGVPVKLVGLGEGADDLAPFEPGAFVDALLG